MKTLRFCLLVAWGTQLAARPLPVLAQSIASPAVARPAAPALAPPLTVAPAVIGTNATITIALPPNATRGTYRIGLFEQGRPVLVAEAVRNFAAPVSLAVQADPGAYEVRVISSDRVRVPLSQPSPLLVTGIRREPGWWLLNGSPFAEAGTQPQAAGAPNLPLFLPGLKRDFARKPRPATQNVASLSTAPVEWRTVALPSLQSLLTANPADLKTRVSDALRQAQTGGQRNYVGFELPVDTAANAAALPPAALNTLTQVRRDVTAVAPDAALILGVTVDPAAPDAAVNAVAQCAPLCDAVLLRVQPDAIGSWPVKAARREAEEQPSYDLPIIVQILDNAARETPPAPNALPESIGGLDYFMSGATGILNGGQIIAGWRALFQRNASLFVGSVTLEDTGLLPLNEGLAEHPDATNQLYEDLRSARRIPLMAHPLLRDKKVPESSVVVLGDRISDSTVQALSATARNGGRLYIEGCPPLDDQGCPIWKLAPLVGATAISVPVKRTTMLLEDPWTFGLGRGGRIAVEQDAEVKLSPGSLPKTPKPEKGRDVLTGPRVAARLEDGSPAVIVTPVDKGEVVWMPYHILPADTPAEGPVAPATAPVAPLSAPNAVVTDVNRSTPLQRYYEAIAADLQQSLVQVRGTDEKQAGAEAIRVALRRSAKGALLLAVYNMAQRPAAVSAAVTGVFGVALDLADEKELPINSRGFQTAAAVTIPPQGWKLIAFGESRKALDAERNAPRAKATLR